MPLPGHVLGGGEKLGTEDDEFDIDLLFAAQRGDVSAFTQVYRRHSRAVLRYAWGKLRDEHHAEEATQDTFTVAWSKIGKAAIVDESLLPWLLVICRNHVHNQLRRIQRQRARESTEDVSVSSQLGEDLAWMRLELSRLSALDQKLCQLCLVEGLTYKEAAVLLDTSETAVGKRLQRARARLRASLGHES